jgi:hypothetical protein
MDRDLLPDELRRARLQRLLRVGLPLLLVAVRMSRLHPVEALRGRSQ